MKEYTTACLIDAPPDTVWAALTDAAAYKDWNPEVVALDGRVGIGERVTARPMAVDRSFGCTS